MDLDQVLKEITSRDTHKVWRSSCEIIKYSQNENVISPLIKHLPFIKKKIANLDMGGALLPNQRFVDFAIKIIEFYRDSKGQCSCCLYLQYGVNPQKEEKNNFISINETMKIEGGWVDYYLASCSKCNKGFKIIEREGHFTWWKWEYA